MTEWTGVLMPIAVVTFGGGGVVVVNSCAVMAFVASCSRALKALTKGDRITVFTSLGDLKHSDVNHFHL